MCYMENIILALPFGSVIMAFVLFALGVAAAYYFVDKDRRARRREENDAEDRLITLLKTTVTEFENKFKAQDEKIAELTKKVDDLEKENGTLVEILQGRDEQTKLFYSRAFKSMEVSQETHKIVLKLAESMSQTNQTVSRLFDLLSKHADVLDHSITNTKK